MTKPNKPGYRHIVMSVLASLFGVQSQNNYQRDFSQGSLLSYVLVGVVMVGLLITALVMLVSYLLP